ncbi:MAG: septin family protein [Rothia sp.]|uniref:septin family protein n=1 Tax=Rothia sp. (in: high G+C Gram-positive bacteria) TaxID=1885016 RepID=UPI001CAB58B4|nr:septin family protein [Rothia sp. (in: high G+C Gram-positive bacteria)]MBF1676295.1 septin family protein [Rothia sp. (in: high G+C Gram-positive bacteria)]
MNLLPVVLRLAGAEVSVYLIDQSEAFIEGFKRAWEPLNPEFFETPDEAYEAVSNHDQVLLVHPVSDTPILDIAQPLMGPFMKVGTLRVDSVEQGLQDLTSRITVAMIEQLVGSGVMLHSAVIGDPESKRALALVGVSGSGKTTASRFLGSKLAYLTDETAVISDEGFVTPYPKPLSVIVDPNAPKEQQNPVEAGLNVVDPEDRGYKLTRIVLISRDEQAKEPRLERVPLHEALVFLSEQSSGLAKHPEGVVSLAKLVERCGGVWRLVYSEVEDTLPLVQDLLNGGELPGADEVESLEKYTVEDHLPGVYLNGTIVIDRAPGTSAVRVGEDGPFLLLQDTALNELSEFAAECWLQAEGDISYDDLYARLAEIFEGLPAEAYDENLSALAAGSMLWVRVIDDPLIDDATWAQITGSEEVLDEAEENREVTSEGSTETAAEADDDVVTE